MPQISIVDLLLPLVAVAAPGIQGVTSGMPDRGYGYRHGTNPKQPKGTGFYGPLSLTGSGESTEITIPKSDNSGEQPQMVPGLSHRELVALLSDSGQMRESIIKKSDDSTAIRKLQGKEPFIGATEKSGRQPEVIPGTSMSLIDILQNAIYGAK